MEGTRASVKEKVEASPLSFLLVEENVEELLLTTEQLAVQLESKLQ